LVHKTSTEQNFSNFRWIIWVLRPFEKIRSMGPTPPVQVFGGRPITETTGIILVCFDGKYT